MTSRRVRLLEEAVMDLESGREFYDRNGCAVGDYFTESLLSDLVELKLHAGIHPVRHGWHRLLSRRFPHAIYYEYDVEEVRVGAVLDMRRSPRWITRSLVRRRKGRDEA
jgi:hypothetical protein